MADTDTQDIKTMHKDTPTGEGESADKGVRIDSDESADPKSGGTPVHKAPSEDSPQS